MKITTIAFTWFLFLFSIQAFTQSSIEVLVKEGIEQHDSGNYEKAIETYQKALKIDPKSTLVNYEISLSYFTNKDYKNAVKYSDAVLNQDTDYMLQAYLTKSSALDLLGKSKESIKLIKKAIKNLEPHYLLYYNLALNYYKLQDYEESEENVLLAIENNSSHSSSHLMLANIHILKGNAVQTLLALHYFLFLEPGTTRSIEANQLLHENFGGNVSQDENEPNTINIMLSLDNDSPFSTAELMISMLEATKISEKNKGKTEDEMFIENTESFFSILGELKDKKNKDLWWSFYVPFFHDLAKSKHLKTYCKYITQSDNDNSKEWLSKNEKKIDAFDKWLNSN